MRIIIKNKLTLCYMIKRLTFVFTVFIMNQPVFSQNNHHVIKGLFKVYKIDNSFDGFHLIFIKNKESNYTIHSEHLIQSKGQKIKKGKEYYFELIRKIDTLPNGIEITPLNYLDISYYEGKYEGTQIGMLCYANNLKGLILDSNSKTKSNKKLFEEIVFKYVHQFPKIDNDCNVKPFYKIYFISSNDTIKFWLGGHIGRPSLVPPLKPGTKPPMNPKELKGILKVNKQPLVVYDYKNSDGYGLFNPKSVNKKRLKKLKEIDDYCAAGVLNPEAWLVAIFNGKLLIIDKREPYRIQL